MADDSSTVIIIIVIAIIGFGLVYSRNSKSTSSTTESTTDSTTEDSPVTINADGSITVN